MSEAEADFMAAGAPLRWKTRFIPSAARLLSVSAAKPRLLSEKYISLSETDKVDQKTNLKQMTDESGFILTHDDFASKQKTLCRRLGGCRRDLRSVSTRPARPSLYRGLRNNLTQLPCIVPPLSLIDLEGAPFLPYY